MEKMATHLAADVSQQRKYVERFRAAQKEEIKWKIILESEVYDLIHTQSNLIGCAKELLLFPLLTTVANCMGPETTVQVGPNWNEKIILWSVIAARRGERKSSAMKIIKTSAKQIEKEIDALNQAKSRDVEGDDNSKFQSGKVVDETALPSIREIFEMRELDGEIPSFLFLLDDFGNVLGKLESLPKVIDMEKTKVFYDGPRQDSMEERKSCAFINFSAMIQATDLPKLMDLPDNQGLFDRLLIVCAAENTDHGYRTSSAISTSPSLQSVLSSVRNFHHVQSVTYSFSPDAEAALNRGLQEFHIMKMKYAIDERCWGACNKASNHVVRLCGVFTALKNGLAMANKNSFLPSRIIDEDTVKRVLILVRMLIRQKLALMSSPVDLGDSELVSSLDMEIEENIESTNNVSTSCQDRPEDVIEINDEADGRHVAINSATATVACEEMVPENLRITDVRTAANSDMIVFREGYTDVVQFSKQEVDQYSPQPVNVISNNNQPINFTTASSSNIDFNPNHTMPAHSEMPQFGQNVFPEIKPAFDHSEARVSFQSRNPHRPRLAPNFEMKTKFAFPGQRIKPRPRPKQMFVNRAVNHLKEKRNFVLPKTGKMVGEDIYKMDEDTFIVQCSTKIRKLLLTKGLVVTASYACQYRLFPPVPLDQRSNSPRTTHPAWAAAKFFEKLGELGLGSMLLFRGHSVKFKKRRLEEMDEKGREILRRINITDEEFERSYPQSTDSVTVGQYQYEFQI